MKVIVLFLVGCCYFASARYTDRVELAEIWGDTKGAELIVFKQVERNANGHDVVEEILTFPTEKKHSKTVVQAIKYYAYHSNPLTNVTIIDGGIGEQSVTIQLRSPPGKGIKSNFSFYATFV